MKPVGIIHQNFQGYLDHLAPLCSLLNIPLLITEKKLEELAKKYYPNLKTILNEDYLSFFKFLAENFNLIFSCQILYSDPATLFSLKSHMDKVNLVWLPHGHSDKGWKTKIFTALKKEKIALVYGKKMIDDFEKQNVKNYIKNIFSFGNYRQHFYQKNKKFYDNLINENILNSLSKNNKNILYAPTWDDYENNSSFDISIDYLIKNLPKGYNLIIKPHPNTYLKHKLKIDLLEDSFDNHPNILILKDFPPIYPLLNATDIYLGDMSSIGYDFLTFNKPMFFLHKYKKQLSSESTFLLKCGKPISLHNQIHKTYNIIKKSIEKNNQKHLSDIREKVLKYTFDKAPDFDSLKHKILNEYI